MTELNAKNKEIYLNLCKKIWDFDDESMSYVNKRLSDDWEPVPEIKELINSPNSTYEDQRIRFKINMSDPQVQSFFEQDDSSYRMFVTKFKSVIASLKSFYNVNITYNDFITNKVVFRKCPTKIKKVFEIAYEEHPESFRKDFCYSYEKKSCAEEIVKAFERIGASKKSAKQLEFVISLNPIDWLLSSTSEEFSSCFNLNNSKEGGYQYCLGLPFLCGDKNRMMLYITGGRKKEFQGIKVDSVQTRTWCILNETGSFNIVKWYPNDTIGHQPVRLITGCDKFDNRDSFTRSKYNLDILSSKLGAYFGVYSDMGKLKPIDNKLYLCGNSKTGQQIFSKNLVDCKEVTTSFSNIQTRFSDLNVSFRFVIPDWIKGGFHFDKMFNTLRCNCCDEDKAGVAVSINTGKRSYNYVCFDCYKNNFKQCKRCGSIREASEKSRKVETLSGEFIELCESCFAESANRICSCCGKYDDEGDNLVRTTEANKICKSCARINGYEKCDDCGKYSTHCTTRFNSFLKSKKTKSNYG